MVDWKRFCTAPNSARLASMAPIRASTEARTSCASPTEVNDNPLAVANAVVAPEPTPVIGEEKADSDDDVRDAWDASSSEDEQEKTTEQPAAGAFIDNS